MRWDRSEDAHGRDDSFLKGTASPGILRETETLSNQKFLYSGDVQGKMPATPRALHLFVLVVTCCRLPVFLFPLL